MSKAGTTGTNRRQLQPTAAPSVVDGSNRETIALLQGAPTGEWLSDNGKDGNENDTGSGNGMRHGPVTGKAARIGGSKKAHRDTIALLQGAPTGTGTGKAHGNDVIEKDKERDRTSAYPAEVVEKQSASPRSRTRIFSVLGRFTSQSHFLPDEPESAMPEWVMEDDAGTIIHGHSLLQCSKWFIFWILKTMLIIAEVILLNFQIPFRRPNTIAQITVLALSAFMFIMQLISDAFVRQHEINKRYAESQVASKVPHSGMTPTAADITIEPAKNIFEIVIRALNFYANKTEYVLECVCLTIGIGAFVKRPGIAALRMFRSFTILWYYDIPVIRKGSIRWAYRLFGTWGLIILGRIYDLMEFASVALMSLGSEMFFVTKKTRGGFVLMCILFFTAYVLGVTLLADSQVSEGDDRVVDDDFTSLCHSNLSCMYSLLRLTFFDGSGLDLLYDLSKKQPLLCSITFIYMCVTSFGIINGLLSIFVTSFSGASSAVFDKEDRYKSMEWMKHYVTTTKISPLRGSSISIKSYGGLQRKGRGAFVASEMDGNAENNCDKLVGAADVQASSPSSETLLSPEHRNFQPTADGAVDFTKNLQFKDNTLSSANTAPNRTMLSTETITLVALVQKLTEEVHSLRQEKTEINGAPETQLAIDVQNLNGEIKSLRSELAAMKDYLSALADVHASSGRPPTPTASSDRVLTTDESDSRLQPLNTIPSLNSFGDL